MSETNPVPQKLVTQTRRLLLVIWCIFVVRGFFYAHFIPMWEGYDEPYHFAFIQHIAAHGSLPIPGETRISREVEESMRLVPLPWMLRHMPAPQMTHDTYWKLSSAERRQRRELLFAIPPSWAREPAAGNQILYEAQQQPLYYWIFSLPLRLISHVSLPGRVLLLRWLNILLSSLLVPMGFYVARYVLGSDATALGVVAFMTAMPELMIDVFRVSNEGLGAVLFSALLYRMLKIMEDPAAAKNSVLSGLTLGLGLLTKSYFLTALPVVIAVYAHSLYTKPGRRAHTARNAAVSMTIAFVLAGWWYWRNRRLTGSWSGLMQDSQLRDVPLIEILRRTFEVDWRSALDSTFVSHIWFGNWSFLQIKSWMYHLVGVIALLAMLGLVRYGLGMYRKEVDRGFPEMTLARLAVLAATYVFFLLGIGYHVLITHAASGFSSSAGWYIYAVVVPEILLATLGLSALLPGRWRTWVLPAGTACFVLLDLYTTHFLLIPYYTGLISHKPNGALPAFHLGQLPDPALTTLLERLLADWPAWSGAIGFGCLWILSIIATLGLAALTLRFRDKSSYGSTTTSS